MKRKCESEEKVIEKNRKKMFNLGVIVPCLLLLISVFVFPTNVEAKIIYANETGLETQHLPAAAKWTATFGYNKTTSFNPTVKMYYLYPQYQ